MAAFNALVRMLEMRLQRQEEALKATREQLEAARFAANGPPSRQADLIADAEGAVPQKKR